MKNKILSLACIVVLAICFQNCESEENARVTTPNGFIQLDSDAATLTENSGDIITTNVLLGSNTRSNDVTVNFTVTSTDASRYTFSPQSGTVVIPAGEVSASITFEAIDNDDIDGDIDVVLALSESSDLPIGIGGEGVNRAEKIITIVDDNVPCNNVQVSVTTDRWGDETSWDILDSNGVRVADGGPYEDLGDDLNETYDTTVMLEDGCYTFRIFDFWGDGMDDGSYLVTCGSLTHASGEGELDGIPGLDVSTVLNPFRAASANNVDPYVNHAESTDFCVNQ